MTICPKFVKRFILLLGLIFGPMLMAHGQTLASDSTANDYAYIYSSGSAFTTGLFSGAAIPTGNINTTPTQVRSFAKFDLAPFQGLTISQALLNLSTYSISGSTHNIGVNVVGYNASGVAFTNSPSILSYSLTSGGTFTVTSAGNYQVDITSAIQSAINAGYAYVTIRLNDNTADGGSTAPYYVMFNPTVTLSLMSGPSQSGLVSTSNDIAWDYASGGAFANGPYSGTIPTGNINTLQTKVKSFFKFPISTLQGATPTNVLLNLSVYTSYSTLPQTIAVNMVNYDPGSGAFSNSPSLIGRAVTSVGNIVVDSATTTYSIDVTSAVQSAISSGYSYIAFRLNDTTTDGGSTAPAAVLFNDSPTLTWHQGQGAPFKTLYVNASTGSDSNNGSSPQEAFKTVGKAQTTVQGLTSSMTGNIEVEMAGGTYFAPTNGFLFTGSDSGKSPWRVIWRNAPGATVIWSGGQQFSSTWSLYSTNVYKSATNPGYAFRQMYINGAPIRITHTAFVGTDALVTTTTTGVGGNVSVSTSHMPAFTAGDPLEINLQCRWTNVIMRIGSKSISGSKTLLVPVTGYEDILQTQPYFAGSNQTYRFQNSKAFLGTNTSGDFYCTTTDGIYVTPPTGVTMSSATVILPLQGQVLGVIGTNTTHASNIAFYGINFEHTNFANPTTQNGYVGAQDPEMYDNTGGRLGSGLNAQYIPAGVQLQFTTNVDMEHCSFQNMGGSGLLLASDVITSRIVSNYFTNIAADALMVGDIGAGGGPGSAHANSNCLISDNLITSCGTDYWQGGGIYDPFSQYNNDTWNTIQDMPSSGFVLGWKGPPANDAAQGSWFAFNYINNVAQISNDAGGFYTVGPLGSSTAPGAQIYRNYIVDMPRWSLAGTGFNPTALYVDEQSGYENFADNEVHNINGVTNPSPPVFESSSFTYTAVTSANNNLGDTMVETNAGQRPGFEIYIPPLPFTSVRNIAAYAKVTSLNSVSTDDNNAYQSIDMRSLTDWMSQVYPAQPLATQTYDFGRAHRITEVEVQSRQDGVNTPAALDNFQIQGTTGDPVTGTYVTLATQSGSLSYGGTWLVKPTPPATSLGTTNYRAIKIQKTDGVNTVVSQVKIYSDN